MVSRRLSVKDENVHRRQLTEPRTIFKLLWELARRGVPESEIDYLVVRHGPVDLDLWQECKKLHPVYGTAAKESVTLRTDSPSSEVESWLNVDDTPEQVRQSEPQSPSSKADANPETVSSKRRPSF